MVNVYVFKYSFEDIRIDVGDHSQTDRIKICQRFMRSFQRNAKTINGKASLATTQLQRTVLW